MYNMLRTKRQLTNQPRYGASLSIKQCRNFGVRDTDVLKFALQTVGLRRFRLMSYWDEIEQTKGTYNFDTLDRQIKTIAQANGVITLCLGARQPRWPESHWPSWTEQLDITVRNQALLDFIQAVVTRYKDSKAIISWQLENEALLKNFGQHGDFDRKRLRAEFKLVKQLDPTRPVIMSTSTSWGIPLRNPIPDIVGFSYYRITYGNGKYGTSTFWPWVFKLRALAIRVIWHKPSFIHEMQAEPWGPKNIWEMDTAEQEKSMSPDRLRANLDATKQINLYPIDMWGLEWWYWLNHNGKPDIGNIVKNSIK